jgi:hypothetical protein
MIHDFLLALAVAVMMYLACVEMAESSPRVAVTVLCWSVPLVLGAVALASLRLVRRMQQQVAWEEQEEEDDEWM